MPNNRTIYIHYIPLCGDDDDNNITKEDLHSYRSAIYTVIIEYSLYIMYIYGLTNE